MEVAVFGDDRTFAAFVSPELLGCTDRETVRAYLAARRESRRPEDVLAGAIVLCWCGDSDGAYAAFREAHERAVAAEDATLAACVLERHAHHALLFGDAGLARETLDAALDLTARRALPRWTLRCAALAARLAVDAGDLKRAAELLALGRPYARERGDLALLAPAGMGVALEMHDEEGLAFWSSPEILEAALTASDGRCATAATVAVLNDVSIGERSVATALRRAILLSLGSSENVEIFSIAARYARIEEARLAANALTALVAAERPYIKAHARLARAHVLLRSGERASGIDDAGDAARAFSAMGLRRWMNEAMMLLLRSDAASGSRKRRGRADGAALTGREEQVAHLIRRGASNREVAVALQISEHTVERHVSSILGRLGLRSRWQIGDPRKH